MNQTNNKEPPESAVKVQSAPCEDSRGTELQTIPESRYSEYATKQENTLEALKKSSAGMIRTQAEREYLPKVVAIPTEQWEAFCAWAREAVTFQPTLYKQIETLATREDLTEMTENFLSEQDGTALELQKSITQTLVGIQMMQTVDAAVCSEPCIHFLPSTHRKAAR